jgi:hypothetical protein
VRGPVLREPVLAHPPQVLRVAAPGQSGANEHQRRNQYHNEKEQQGSPPRFINNLGRRQLLLPPKEQQHEGRTERDDEDQKPGGHWSNAGHERHGNDGDDPGSHQYPFPVFECHDITVRAQANRTLFSIVRPPYQPGRVCSRHTRWPLVGGDVLRVGGRRGKARNVPHLTASRAPPRRTAGEAGMRDRLVDRVAQLARSRCGVESCSRSVDWHSHDFSKGTRSVTSDRCVLRTEYALNGAGDVQKGTRVLSFA